MRGLETCLARSLVILVFFALPVGTATWTVLERERLEFSAGQILFAFFLAVCGTVVGTAIWRAYSE